MPIWNVTVTGEWFIEGVEADNEYDAEDLAIDYIYNVEPDWTSSWATKVQGDEEDNG